MKTCIIKQPYVTEFTYESIIYRGHTPEQILDKFIHRSQSFGMITALEMDIYVVRQMIFTPESEWYRYQDKEAFELFVKRHDPIDFNEIPLDNYDIVITADCFIPKQTIEKHPNTLFAYFSTEHHLDAYKITIEQGPQEGYDIFLDHALSSSYEFDKLPARVNFPFMIDKDAIRKIINLDKKADSVFLDSNVVSTIGFTKSTEMFDENNLKKYTDEVKRTTGLRTTYAPPYNYARSYYCVAKDEIIDTETFLELLAHSKFFPLCRGNLAIGQALSEAASVRNVVISDDMRYSKLVCHPKCRIEPPLWIKKYGYLDAISQKKAYNLIAEIKNNSEFIEEALDYQDKMLDSNFKERPMEIVKKALRLKRGE